MPDNFDRETRYQLVMHYCRKMLDEGILTKAEYAKAENAMCEKYNPAIGKLFSSL